MYEYSFIYGFISGFGCWAREYAEVVARDGGEHAFSLFLAPLERAHVSALPTVLSHTMHLSISLRKNSTKP